MSDRVQSGWYADPYGRHQNRYHDGTTWTDSVADDGVQQLDPIVAEPPAATVGDPNGAVPTNFAAGATAVPSLHSLPDDPAGAPKRRTWALVIFGACGVLLLSLFLPWLEPAQSGSGRSSLNGISTGVGMGALMIGAGLVAFASQGLNRPRVRFGIGAIIGSVMLVALAFGVAIEVSDDDIEKMGMRPASTRSYSTGGVRFEIEGGSSSSSTPSAGNAKLVSRGTGSDIALIAGLGALVGSIILFKDDRARRLAAQMHAAGGGS